MCIENKGIFFLLNLLKKKLVLEREEEREEHRFVPLIYA